jgi:branched-chain amino acid transport system permease protein
MDVVSLINLALNGFLLGGLFAITAVGFSVIAGIMRIINVAHGDFAILAAYLTLSIMNLMKVDPLLALIVVAPIMFGLGFLLQRVIINRVLPKGVNQIVMVTFALCIVIQNILLLIFTYDARSLVPPYLLVNIQVLGLNPSPRYLLGFISALTTFVVIYLLFKRTYLGKAMRAVSFDSEAAKLVGIKSEIIYSHAVGLAFLVTGVTGVLLGMVFTFYPDSGSMYTLLSFGVVVVGGLGSLKGSLLGGFIMGEALVLGGIFFGSPFQLIFCYLIILIILIVKPQGLFGRKL